MKYSRKDLEVRAAALRAEYKVEDKSVDVIRMSCDKAFKAFGEFLQTSPTEDAVKARATAVKEVLAYYNDQKRIERLDELKAMGNYTLAMTDYIRNQCVTGLAMTHDTKNESWALEDDNKVELEALDVIDELNPVARDGIIDMCCIFADNLARFDSNDEKATVTNRTGLSESYMEMRKRFGWDTPASKLSKTVLAKQMTELVQKICRGLDITMIGPDVRFVKSGVLVSQSKANQAGRFVLKNERTIINFIFRAAYTRYNKLPYEFQNDTRAEKKALGYTENKPMGEKATGKEKPATVVSETVKVEETK